MAHRTLTQHFLLKSGLLLLLERRLRVKYTTLDVLRVRLVPAPDLSLLLLSACTGRWCLPSTLIYLSIQIRGVYCGLLRQLGLVLLFRGWPVLQFIAARLHVMGRGLREEL